MCLNVPLSFGLLVNVTVEFVSRVRMEEERERERKKKDIEVEKVVATILKFEFQKVFIYVC